MNVRLSTKGQLVIPKEIRERHGWTPGCRLEVEDRGDAVVIREAVAAPPATRLEDLVGCLGYEGPVVSVEQMDEAIAEGARRQR
jgi:AbrB family looped-hinge helix DNA binding protein